MKIFVTLIFCFLLIGQMVSAKMVYLHQEGETRRVALANDQGQFIRYLTPSHLQAYHPEISSDGRYVAYSIGKIIPGDVSVAIHVLDLREHIREVWTLQGDQYIHAEFSGDGRYLFFSGPMPDAQGGQIQNIGRIDLKLEREKSFKFVSSKDHFETRIYTPQVERVVSPFNSYFPAVSSDGSFVIFHTTEDPSSKTTPKEIWSYDFRFRQLSRVTEPGVHAMVPSLSADDQNVVYAGISNGQWDIFRIDLITGDKLQITNSKEREFTPVYSHTGAVYYTLLDETQGMEIDIYSLTREEVLGTTFVVNPQPFIAQKGVFEYVPSFSGDLSFSKKLETPLLDPPRSSFAAVQSEKKIYVIGGHQGPEHTYPKESFLNTLDIYDVEEKIWKRGAPLPTPRHGFEAVVYQGAIYVFGGFAYSEHHDPQWKSLDTIERYDIFEDRWVTLNVHLPRPRSSNVAARVGDKVYLMGGWNSTPKFKGDKDGKFHSEIDVFDLKTLKVSTLNVKLPNPLRRAFTAVTVNNKVYLLGGISEGASHFDWLDAVTVFDPITSNFEDLEPLPFQTFAPGAEYYNGKLFLFGGMVEGLSYVNTIYSLELGREGVEWINTGRYLNESKGFPIAIKHPDGGIAILGGHQYIFDGSKNIIDHPVSTFEWLK